MMLTMRPSKASPTGTVIGAPVSHTGVPQDSPDVSPMATHLTVLIFKVLLHLQHEGLSSLRTMFRAWLIGGRGDAVIFHVDNGPDRTHNNSGDLQLMLFAFGVHRLLFALSLYAAAEGCFG